MSADGTSDSKATEARLVFDAERAKVGLPASTAPEQPVSIGIALSGGGIRSATFCLGVLQSFAERKLLPLVHYLSSVSGGGFVASFVHRLIKETPENWNDALTPKHDSSTDANPQISHLRRYSNYLIPNKSLFSNDTAGTLGAALRNIFLIQLQLICFLLLLPLLGYLVLGAVTLYLQHVNLLLSLGLFVVAISWSLLLFNFRLQQLRIGQVGQAAEAMNNAKRTLIAIGAAAIFGTLCVLLANDIDLLRQLPGWKIVSISALSYWLIDLACWLVARAWVGVGNQTPNGSNAQPSNTRPTGFDFSIIVRSVIAAMIGGAFGGMVIVGFMLLLQRLIAGQSDTQLIFAAWLGPPALTLAMLSAAALQLGMSATSTSADNKVHAQQAARAQTDLTREFWARVGGQNLLMFGAVWVIAAAVILLSPWLLSLSMFLSAPTGVIWMLISGWGVKVANSARTGSGTGDNVKNLSFDWIARIAPYVFVIGLLGMISAAALHLLAWAANAAPIAKEQSFQIYCHELANIVRSSWMQKLPWTAGLPVLLGLAGLWWILNRLIDINEFGQTKLYQLRLTRCYQGAARAAATPPRAAEPLTNFDPNDDVLLSDLAQKPYPLINCALNLVQASDNNLDWQDRKAANFVLSPLFCGFLPGRFDFQAVGDVIGDPLQASATAESMSLGTAVAISGAAANPNMGYHSSPAVSFLLTLFNVRLGWWLPNRRVNAGGQQSVIGNALIREMLGQTSAHSAMVNLSDGGHFENTAVYELLRRRVRLIIACDCGADPRYQYADMAGLVRKARIDFNAEIEFVAGLDLPKLEDQRALAMAKIRYAGQASADSYLLVIKPILVEGLPTDVAHYASRYRSFPQQSTADQFFDEAQFESYRKLARIISAELFTKLGLAGAIASEQQLFDAVQNFADAKNRQ
jgi:predicted acylesterase/phospholipase RssA